MVVVFLVLAEARQAIWSVNGRQPVFLVTTLKELNDRSMARTSFTLVMLAIAGGMALVLGKSADGLQSLAWVKEGRIDLVEAYCRRDVEILRDLYLHGRREGCLVYHDRRRDVRLRLAVEW